MTEALTRPELSTYNRAAIDFASKLHELRAAQMRRDNKEVRPLDQLLNARNRAALGVALEYERMGNQPISDGLLDRAASFGLEFEHLGLTLGTVIHNVDLSSVPSTELVLVLRHTLLERKVIFFRDQHLSQEQQVAFARCFGELDAFPFGKPGTDPFILEIRHNEHSPGTENGWHTDVTWMEEPSLGSVAQCVVVPPKGGDTLFSDSHACYLGLPTALKDRIEYLHGINDYRFFTAQGGLDAPSSIPAEMIDELKAEIPFGVDHPLVRTHPETGKPALYLNAGFLRHDSLYDVRTGEPVGADESVKIVTKLLTQPGRPEYVCRFRWQEGSIAFWDNRAVQHYAASDYYPHKRVLRRVTISGDRPFYESARR